MMISMILVWMILSSSTHASKVKIHQGMVIQEIENTKFTEFTLMVQTGFKCPKSIFSRLTDALNSTTYLQESFIPYKEKRKALRFTTAQLTETKYISSMLRDQGNDLQHLLTDPWIRDSSPVTNIMSTRRKR